MDDETPIESVIKDDLPTFSVIDGDSTPQPERPADAPPRRTRKPPNTKTDLKSRGPHGKRVPTPDYAPGVIAAGLTNTYTQMAMVVGMFDPHCAQALMANAKPMAESLDKWAKHNPQVRAFLMQAVTTSVLGEVFFAHMPVIAAIGSHHIPTFRAKMEANASLTEENLRNFTTEQKPE